MQSCTLHTYQHRVNPMCMDQKKKEYMDGIGRTIEPLRKAACILQMTRDRWVKQSMVANVCKGTL